MNCAIIKTHSGGACMIELNQLRQLLVIEKEETLSKASEKLFISQPALTRSMQKLEKELGVSLFDRKKNKITLNDNGKEALKYAKKIINETNKMKDHLISFDQSNRSFHIGSYAPAPLWPINYLLKQYYPYASLSDEVLSSEEQLLSGLYNDNYHMILLHYPIHNEELKSIKIFKEELYLSIPKDHVLSSRNTISFKELDGTSVLLRTNLGYWKKLNEEVIPHSNLLFQDDENVLDELIKASSLPSFRTNISLLRKKEEKNRIYIPFIDKEASVTFYAIYKKEYDQYFSSLEKDLPDVDISKI